MTRCFPFDSVVTGQNEYGLPQGDRDYNSSDMRKYISSFLTTGIKNGDTNLKVSVSDGLNIKVQEGTAIIEGAFFELYDEPENLKVSANKKSRIIVRLDLNEDVRNVYLTVLEGDNINPPELTRNSVIYEISLAQIETDENAITNIIDERADISLCGYINSLIKVDVTELLSKIETELANIENGSLIALKNGILQKNLNADKIQNKNIDDLVPLGTIKLSSNKNINDEHYLICDGAILEMEDYPQLKGILSTAAGRFVEEDNLMHRLNISNTNDGFMFFYNNYIFYGFDTNTSKFYYSDNYGETTKTIDTSKMTGELRCIIKFKNLFVAFTNYSNNNYIYTSGNLKDWTLRLSNFKSFSFNEQTVFNFSDKLLVIRKSAEINEYYSFDGMNWNKLGSRGNYYTSSIICFFKNDLYFFQQNSTDKNVICQKYKNDHFSESATTINVMCNSTKLSGSFSWIINIKDKYLIAKDGAKIYKSFDGETFVELTNEENTNFDNVIFNNNGKIYAKKGNEVYEFINDEFKMILKDFLMPSDYNIYFFYESTDLNKYFYGKSHKPDTIRITPTNKFYIPEIIDEKNSLYGHIKVLKEGED